MAEDKRLDQNEVLEENVQKDDERKEDVEKEEQRENKKNGGLGVTSNKELEKGKKDPKEETEKVKEGAQKEQKLTFKLPSRKKLEMQLKQSIIGQDSFIKQVTVAVYRRYLLGLKSNVMVLGDSGSGKTATLKLMAEMLGLPYTIESATEYTQSGYVGKDLEDIVNNLFFNASCRGLVPLLLNGLGIVIIDEIDKKAERSNRGFIGNSVSGKAVQQRLLKFIEGMDFPMEAGNGVTVNFSTENLLVICMGAFEGLDKVRKERKKTKGSIGFAAEQPREESLVSGFIEQDFIEYGLIREFIGRFDCIAKTKTLTEKDLKQIILYSRISAFREYENVLKRHGIRVVYSMRMIQKLAERAFLMNTGARAIKNVVNYMFENIFCDLMDVNYPYTKCTLDDEIVYDNTRYILE